MTSLTFCDGESDKCFAALTKVGSQIAYGAIVDPYPVRFVSGCVTYIARRQGANVSEAAVGLSMPVSGFMKADTLCIVKTLPNALIQATFAGNEINVRIEITMSFTYGSGFMA